jgi:hypothetical protein
MWLNAEFYFPWFNNCMGILNPTNFPLQRPARTKKIVLQTNWKQNYIIPSYYMLNTKWPLSKAITLNVAHNPSLKTLEGSSLTPTAASQTLNAGREGDSQMFREHAVHINSQQMACQMSDTITSPPLIFWILGICSIKTITAHSRVALLRGPIE